MDSNAWRLNDQDDQALLQRYTATKKCLSNRFRRQLFYTQVVPGSLR
jgi:hypothetical protein